QLGSSDIVHAMIPVAQIESLLQSQSGEHGRGVAFIGEHGLAEAEVEGILLVVAGADEVAGVAFLKQLGDGAGREDRAIVEMRRHQGQRLASMWSSGHSPFQNNARTVLRIHLRGQGAAREGTGQKVSSYHIWIIL